MALASQGFFLTVDLVDQGGNKSTLRYDLVAADFATAETDAATIIAALNAVTTALIYAYRLGEKYVEDTLAFGAGEIENIGLVTAKLVTPGKTVNVKIPAPEDTLFVGASGPDYNEMDPNEALTQAYLAIWENPGQAVISDGEYLRDSATAGNWTGKRIHRGSRKG